MSSEQEVVKKIEQYQELAKTDKNVDVATLALNELERANQAQAAGKRRWLAYFIAVGFPPFGLIFSVYYFFRNRPGDRRAALWCVILTVLALLLVWWSMRLLISSFVPPGSNLSNIKPEDLLKQINETADFLRQ